MTISVFTRTIRLLVKRSSPFIFTSTARITTSAANLSQVLPDNIELIISTINLPTVTMPVAYVTAFFNDADIKRVTEMVITEKLHHATSRVVEI